MFPENTILAWIINIYHDYKEINNNFIIASRAYFLQQMVKPRLGIAGGVLLKANCQGVPIIDQPRKEHKIREHNTDMTETRAARVEQNTRREAEPSTLYQVYRCIKIT